MTQAITISAESLAKFQNDKNVVNNELPTPPRMLVAQKDGSLLEVTERDIHFAGHEIDRISFLFDRHGYTFGRNYFEHLSKICPNEFEEFTNSYEKLWEAYYQANYDFPD